MSLCGTCGGDNPVHAQVCQACGAALRGAPAPAEVRKTVTVVFCDLAGSTNLAEQLDPETLRRVISRYYEEMSRTVERHGGAAAKFIGDAVMAVFGIPVLHEDDALRAVRAAADMGPAIDRLNDELEARWGVRLEVRMGVNTGEVVVGDPSQAQSLVVGEVVGDAVNVAARLERAAEAQQVLIGAETHRLVRDAVRVEEIEPLDLKGKARPVRAYRVLEVVTDTPGVARTLHSPIVGRHRELGLLRDVVARAFEDRCCQLATVLGPAGIGKSRLVHELVTQLKHRATIMKGRCLPYGEGITFWPIAEIVKESAGIGEGDSQEEAATKIASLLQPDDDASEVVRAVAGAIGVSETPSDKEDIFWAVRRLFEALARDRPLIVVFDDIHWAEATFLDLVESVAVKSRGVPLLVLCTARPDLLELRRGWSAAIEGASSLLLEPLADADSRRMVENLLGVTELTEEIAERIASTAAGNPLFLEEMLRMLIDDGLLQQEHGRWRAVGKLSDVRVPSTIRALLAARLDRLTQEERVVIERAAVVGQEFWPGAVSELLPQSIRSKLDTHLELLVRKALIEPGGAGFAGEDALRFSHILIRDAAYEEMLKETRAELHERFAAWLERKAGERAAEYDEILGYHVEQAYRYRRELGPVGEQAALARNAATRLSKAGRRALARGDMPAAVNLLERAVSLLPEDDPERSDLLLKFGIALAETGELGRADALLSERIREGRRGLAFLSYRDGAGKQHVFDLDRTRSRVTIGRKPSNDISLEWDSEVSRLHASVIAVRGRWVLLDDGRSRNGSFVNGQRMTGRHLLEDGDILRFGETLILYRAPLTSEPRPTRGMDPRSTTATATSLPAAVLLSETQRRVLIALSSQLEEGPPASMEAADREIAKQLSLNVDAVRENLLALSHVFETEQLPEEQKVARLVERARQSGLVSGDSP